MVFGVADDNVPMRESPENLIRAVGIAGRGLHLGSTVRALPRL
jgi:hypothetical protein